MQKRQKYTFLYYMHQYFKFFNKCCPDDSLSRPPPVANNTVTITHTAVSDGLHI